MSPGPGALTEVLFSLRTGGSERVGSDLARFAVARGIPTTVCSTHEEMGPIGRALETEGIDCEPLQLGWGGRLGRAWRLYRHLRRHGTTVVHAHHFNMLSIALRPATLAGVERVVVTEHTDHELRNSAGARRIAARFGRRADLITVVHQGIADYLIRGLKLDPDKIRVIPNGVDTDRFEPTDDDTLRALTGAADDVCLVGTVGRLHPDKDPLNLLLAVESMDPADRAALHVVIIGDGELRAELETRIRELDLESSVTMLGERQDVSSLLPGLDVFALPSRTEGLPVAVLEAMSCGLPVVATAVGGVPAAVGDCGIMVPPSRPGALAEALVELVRDPARRERLGRSARERAVEHFDISVMFEAYASALGGSGTLRFDTASTRESG